MKETMRALQSHSPSRMAAATVRFLLIVGAIVTFAADFLQTHELSDLGLALVMIAALFYDPDNPPGPRHP